MKLAITVWNDRIAPVFDCARTALVFDAAQGRVVSSRVLELGRAGLEARARLLEDAGVEELICGAASIEAARAVRERGIAVRAFRSGEVETVIQAWLQGILDGDEFAMPGCACARRGRGAGHSGMGRCRRRGPRHD